MKKIISAVMALVMVISMIPSAAFATDLVSAQNVTYPSGVTPEMTKASYWSNIAISPDKVLMDTNDIQLLNDSIENESATHRVNLENLESIGKGEFYKFDRDLYINGELIDEDAYLSMFSATHTEVPLTYAVAVKRTDIKSWPIIDVLGYTADDPDDEAELDIMNVNEPFIIGGKCVVDGHTFYYGTSDCFDGWVDSENVAICQSKDEWLDAWKVNPENKDFLVVTQAKLTTEPMLLSPEISKIELMMGTILKLVPSNEIPNSIGERTDNWFNYVVYIPTRDLNGYYIKKPALIQERYAVNLGFMPLTQKNLLDLSFAYLGDRYGWGGMLESNDSSLYSRAVYKCFGINLPRNSTQQTKIPGKFTDISGMTEAEKLEYLKTIPVGSILWFSGFTMHYIGNVNNMAYVIATVGVLSDSGETVDVQRRYTVSVVPLTVKRKNGNTWLQELSGVINVSSTTLYPEKVEPDNPVKPVAKPTIKLKAVAKKHGNVKLTWTISNIKPTNIIVYKAKGNKKLEKATKLKGSKKSYVVKKLKAKKTYRFKVVAVKDKKKISSKVVKLKAKA